MADELFDKLNRLASNTCVPAGTVLFRRDVGGVTGLQLRLMSLDEVAVAISPVGAEGAVVHDVEPPPPPLSGDWMPASIDCFCALTGVGS